MDELKKLKLTSTSKAILIIFGFGCFVVITFVAAWKYYEKRAEMDVSDGEFDEFPVVVIRANSAEVAFLKPDGSYEPKSADDSFLVPEGKEDLINRWLRESQKARGAKGTPEVLVRRFDEGKQKIELEILGDGLFLSRYEASSKSVRPLTFTLSGPLFPLMPCEATVIIGIIGFSMMQVVLWFTRRRSRTIS